MACRCDATCSSRIARRLTTTLPRLRFIFSTRTVSSRPFHSSRSRTGCRSACDAGKNARTPMSTTRPPLMWSTIFPVMSDFCPVGLFNLAPRAPPLHALVRQQHHSFLAIARALDFDRLPDHQRERPVQFREFLRGNQPLGLAAQIHDHAQIGDRHDLARFDLAFRRRLMRHGVLLHELFHLRVRFRGRLAGIRGGFHRFAHVGMFDGGSAIRRGHRLRRSHGNNGRLRGRRVQQRQWVLALELRQAAACSVSTFVVCSGAAVAAVAVCPAESSAPGFSLSENILLPPVRSLPCSQQETPGLSSESRGGARKEVRLPTQVPHRGDDTRALWPMSMKAVG